MRDGAAGSRRGGPSSRRTRRQSTRTAWAARFRSPTADRALPQPQPDDQARRRLHERADRVRRPRLDGADRRPGHLARADRLGRRRSPLSARTSPRPACCSSRSCSSTRSCTRAPRTCCSRLGRSSRHGHRLDRRVQAALRVLAFATSVALFALTTRTDELVDDLERRGLGRRAAFILTTAIGTVPRLAERAREIVEAQRSAGLNTEGGFGRARVASCRSRGRSS